MPGLTFPTCKPVKRIDFIFVRNNSLSDSTARGLVYNVEIIGNEPTKDTMHLVGSREGLGMSDMDSPIWASDHMAVASDLLIDAEAIRA
jgi:hypothetical protein